MNNLKYNILANRITVIGYCLLVIVFTSCSNEDYLGGHYTTDGAGTKMTVTAEISVPANTALTWVAGDVIGIATGYGQYDVTARNRQYVCQADGKTFCQATGYPIYVKGNTDIVAYWPFSGTDGAEPTLTLDTRDQDNVTDYLFAKAKGVTLDNGSNVHLVFDYALARLQINIVAPDGESIRECRLQGFAQQASVSPYTLEMTLDAPEDLVVKGAALSSLSLKLIPQTVSTEAAVPAQLVLIGSIRSYTIDMSQLKLVAGAPVLANVNVTDGIGTVDFVPGGSAWTDSGLGGDVSAE